MGAQTVVGIDWLGIAALVVAFFGVVATYVGLNRQKSDIERQKLAMAEEQGKLKEKVAQLECRADKNDSNFNRVIEKIEQVGKDVRDVLSQHINIFHAKEGGQQQ